MTYLLPTLCLLLTIGCRPGIDPNPRPVIPPDPPSPPSPPAPEKEIVPQDTWPLDAIALADAGTDSSTSPDFVWAPKTGHPKLFVDQSTIQAIKTKLSSGAQNFKAVHSWIMDRADKTVQTAPSWTYSTANSMRPAVFWPAETRIISCSYAYLVTGQTKYRDAAYRDAEKLCGMPTWNGKTSGLDFTEAAFAVAIAYDWLYDSLTESQRTTLRNGLYTKGLKPHLDAFSQSGTYKSGIVSQNYLIADNNWNAVCTGGLTVAALALADEYPEDTRRVGMQCIKANVSKSKRIYGVDGTYPEGYGYWGFGTNLECAMAAAVETACGNDYVYENLQGFRSTWKYMQHVESFSTNCAYNYMDSSYGLSEMPLWYFARKENNPDILWSEIYKLKNFSTYASGTRCYNKTVSVDGGEAQRLMPIFFAMAVHMDMENPKAPVENTYIGWGLSPVAMFHNGWTGTAQDSFLGVKAGSASNVTHSHMDAGSFVYDANGVRWAHEYGTASYINMQNICTQLTGNDLGFWSYNSTAYFRWTINVLNNSTHNTLSIAGELHNPTGKAVITAKVDNGTERGVVMDMSAPLSGKNIQKAERRITLGNDNAQLCVMDRVITRTGRSQDIEWRMLTRQVPTVTADGILLTNTATGKQALLSTKYIDASVEYQVFPYTHRPYRNAGTDVPNTWDVNLEASGMYVVGFKATVKDEMIFTTTIIQK